MNDVKKAQIIATMSKNKHLIRVGQDELSLYSTIRIAERFAGISNDTEARAEFIRQWAKAPERQNDKNVQKFLHQSLMLNTKSFGHRWRKMEKRVREIHEYAVTISDKTDKERLQIVLNDLGRSGYLIKQSKTSELTVELSRQEAKRVLQVGLIAIKKDEWEKLEQNAWLNDDTIIINPMTYQAGTYLALIDSLQIAGLEIKAHSPYQKGKLMEVTLGTSAKSRFKKTLEALAIPQD